MKTATFAEPAVPRRHFSHWEEGLGVNGMTLQ
jgi:hypothetical protein